MFIMGTLGIHLTARLSLPAAVFPAGPVGSSRNPRPGHLFYNKLTYRSLQRVERFRHSSGLVTSESGHFKPTSPHALALSAPGTLDCVHSVTLHWPGPSC